MFGFIFSDTLYDASLLEIGPQLFPAARFLCDSILQPT
jgi:hypothetical protein